MVGDEPCALRSDRRVRLAGLSRVAGGADGWLSDSAVVFDFEVQDGPRQHTFSMRYSSSLTLHKRMVAAELGAISRIDFPGKCRLSNMVDNIDNVLSRGRDLAQYYTKVLAAAAMDPVVQTWVDEELFGIPAGCSEDTMAQESSAGALLDGVLAFQCDDREPLFLRCSRGSILEICASAPGEAIAKICATQQLWRQCTTVLLQTGRAQQVCQRGRGCTQNRCRTAALSRETARGARRGR